MVNITEATSQYSSNGLFKTQTVAFSSYCPAYVTTNENLRHAINVLNPRGAKVLTTAASGDQPMFFKLYGADEVHTFDITYCSRAVMDLKTMAMRKLSYPDYIEFVKRLPRPQSLNAFPGYDEILSLCPKETRKFLSEMNGRSIFNNGVFNDESLPTEQEYLEIKRKIRRPFRFIWIDLASLSRRIKSEYDQIYLSNIFQYEQDPDKIVSILNSLRPYLSMNGKIMVHATWFFGPDECEKYRLINGAIKDWAKMTMFKHMHRQEIIVLEKMR